MTTPRELKSLYETGENITAYMRQEKGTDCNSEEIIEIAYDLQAGTYTDVMRDVAVAQHKKEYAEQIAVTILAYCKPTSIMEAGVGEATTLSGVLERLGPGTNGYGFDLSWSRVAYARRWLQQHSMSSVLCTGSLFNIPFASNSIDVVYTSHSIEPNGGNEQPILRELFRVAGKFLILFEPGYELANAEARQRMASHGYCRNLKGIADALGYEVVEHKLLCVTSNPLNPTAVIVIRKNEDPNPRSDVLVCPKYKTMLQEIGGMLFSPEALVVYPIVDGIPCLRVENGIVAGRYPEIVAWHGRMA